MDAFHSRHSDNNTQNLSKNYSEILSWSQYRRAEFLRDLEDAYDRKILYGDSVSRQVCEVVSLYRIYLDSGNGGSVTLGSGDDQIKASEFGVLADVVHRHLGGDEA